MTESIKLACWNPAPEWQDAWMEFVVPTSRCKDWGDRAWIVDAEGDQSGLPAVMVERDEHGTTWASPGPWPNGRFTRYLMPERAMANEKPWPLPPYIAHPAVYDDLKELDPSVKHDGMALPARRVAPVAGAQHVDLVMSKGNAAWHADIRLRNYSRSPLVRFHIRVVWSDLSSTASEMACHDVTVSFGEKMHLDFGREVGWTMVDDMTAKYDPPQGVLAKGQALDLSGFLLCREANERGVDKPADPLDWHENSLRELTEHQLELATYGPVVAMPQLDGDFLAFDVVPETPREGTSTSIPTDADFYDVRPAGMPKRTGSTGAQAAFGVMGHAVMMDPPNPLSLRWLQWTSQRWSSCTIHHRDAQGRPIRAVDHPDMHEFGMLPFSKQGAKDCLGMVDDQWHPTPWSGEWPACDEMHDQLWPLCSYYALTHDPLARDTLESWIEMRMRYVRTHGAASMGMNRSAGRMTLNMVNAGLVLGGEKLEQVKQWVSERSAIIKDGWDGRNLSGPVKPCQINGADPRGIVDPSTGEPVPFIFPLFESLAGIGIVAGARLIGDSELLDVGRTILHTFVWHLLWQDATGKWKHPWNIAALPDGAPIPQGDRDTWLVKSGNDDSYFEQSLGGVILLRDITTHQETKTRCQAIIDSVTGGLPPRRAFGAHHWCTGTRNP